MNNPFEESVLDSLKELGWAPSDSIAEHADWDVGTVVECINNLKDEGKIISKIMNGKIVYRLFGEERIVPKDGFATIGEYMIEAIDGLPRDREYRATEIAKEIIKIIPSKWNEEDIVKNLALMCRLRKIDIRRGMAENRSVIKFVVI